MRPSYQTARSSLAAAASCPALGILRHRDSIPRSVAMKLTGHKTESIYRRYAIVSEADLAEGVSRRARFRSKTRTVPAQSRVLVGDAADDPIA